MCVCVRICAHKCRFSRKLEMSESLELETQVLVSYLTRVLETELKSVLNHFFPLPLQIFLNQLDHPNFPSHYLIPTIFCFPDYSIRKSLGFCFLNKTSVPSLPNHLTTFRNFLDSHALLILKCPSFSENCLTF